MTDGGTQDEREWYKDDSDEIRMKDSGDRMGGYFASLPDGRTHVIWHATTACGKAIAEGEIPPADEAIKPGSRRCDDCARALEEKGEKLNWPI